MNKKSIFAGVVLVAVIVYQQYQLMVLEDNILEVKEDILTILDYVLKSAAKTNFRT